MTEEKGQQKKKKSERGPGKKYFSMKRGLKKKLETVPTLEMNSDELRDVIVEMAQVARMEGITLMGELCTSAKMEHLLGAGTRLILDGTHPAQVEGILEPAMETMLLNYEARCRMIIAGILAIQGAWNPRLIDQKLSGFYSHMGGAVC